jgi:hypothetical protein
MDSSSQHDQVETQATSPANAGAGRDENGRFTAGNKLGVGNPFARQTAAMRKAIIQAITEQDLEEITRAMIDKAKRGDTAAAKLVFAYSGGTPTRPQNPDTLDRHEFAVYAGNHVIVEEFEKLFTQMPVSVLVTMSRVLRPYIEKARAMNMEETLEKMGRQMDRRAEERQEEVEQERREEEADEAAGRTQPAPATRAVAGQEDLNQTLAKWEKETEELRERLRLKQFTEGEAEAPAGVVHRLDAVLGAADTSRADAAGPGKRGQPGCRPGLQPGRAPSRNGSSGRHGGGTQGNHRQ